MNAIWDLHVTLTWRLLWWSAGSILAGAILLLVDGPLWRAFGVQAVAWGAIDAAIALLGRWSSKRRQRAYDDPTTPQVVKKEGNKLRRLLWINTGLDVLYVASGLALALTLGATSAALRGHGWGIAFQGAFLFFFDLIHVQSIPLRA